MNILVDFDGTCVTHKFPKVGTDIGAAPVLRALVNKGHRLILFTMRCDHDFTPTGKQPGAQHPGGNYLTEAIRWFENNGIPLYGINEDPGQKMWTSSPKAYGEMIIDDTALGCPLIQDELDEKPYVNWAEVYNQLQEMKLV